MVEAIVNFSEKSLTVTDSRDGATMKTFPYTAVTHATISRARNPRGSGGKELETPGGIPGGNIFARGPRLWMAIQTADDQPVLRFDQEQLRPMADLVAQRTRVLIERYMEPQP